MPRNPGLTDTEKARIAELHAAGKGRNDIARDLERSGDTIHRYCKKVGLLFDRTSTKAATEARKLDNAAIRQEAQTIELAIMRHMQDEVRAVQLGTQKHKTMIRSSGGAEVEASLSFVPPGDYQKLSNSRSSASTIIKNLALMDAGAGTEEDRQMLLAINAALGRSGHVGPDGDRTGLDPETG